MGTGMGQGSFERAARLHLRSAVLLPYFPCQPLPLAAQVQCHHLFLLDNPMAPCGTVLGACGFPMWHVGPGVVLLACQLQRVCLRRAVVHPHKINWWPQLTAWGIEGVDICLKFVSDRFPNETSSLKNDILPVYPTQNESCPIIHEGLNTYWCFAGEFMLGRRWFLVYWEVSLWLLILVGWFYLKAQGVFQLFSIWGKS